MPSWLAPLLGFLVGAPIVIWVLNLLNDRSSGKSAEHGALVREGAEVVTPARELAATRLGPGAIVWGSDEELQEHLRETHELWWGGVRDPLLTYANRHPSGRVRELTRELVDAVALSMASTKYLLISRRKSTTMDAHDDCARATDAAVARADELMDEIRSRRPRLRLPRR